MAQNNKPSPAYFNVMHVKEIGNEQNPKKMWTKCGVAFPLREKEGFTLKLEYLPVGGVAEFVLLLPLEKDERN